MKHALRPLFLLMLPALVLAACSEYAPRSLDREMAALGVRNVTFDGGTVLSGATTPTSFTVTVTAESDTAWVDFAVDGTKLARSESAPFTHELTVTPGEHVLELMVKPGKGKPGRLEVPFTAEATDDADGSDGSSDGSDDGSGGTDGSDGTDAEPTPEGTPLPRVVSGYYWMSYLAAHDVWQRHGTDEYLVGAASNGWDWLDLPDGGAPTVHPRSDWVHFELRREATVGVAWMDDLVAPDAWLDDWTDAGTVEVGGTTGRLFTKTLPAGSHSLPSFDHKNRRIYELLFAEADGSPTPYPEAPAGREQPVPGEYCPAWVHDTHVTDTGYLTWHPQVDPAYWCYFGHEHGSDPSFVSEDYEPEFNRYSQWAGDEPNQGFKVFTFEGDDETRWAITLHFTTGMEGRKCVRFHTFDLYVVDRDGTLLADVRGKGDTGGLAKAGTFEPMNPDDCPDVNVGTDGQEKNIPVAPDTGYESWEIEWGSAIPTGGDIVLTTVHPGLWCDDVDCNTMSPREGGNVLGNFGTNRWFTLPGGEGSTLFLDGNERSGTFCTNYTADEVLACDDPDAIEQYIAPGVHSVTNPANKFYPLDPWERLYVSHLQDPETDMFIAPRMNVAGMVRVPN